MNCSVMLKQSKKRHIPRLLVPLMILCILMSGCGKTASGVNQTPGSNKQDSEDGKQVSESVKPADEAAPGKTEEPEPLDKALEGVASPSVPRSEIEVPEGRTLVVVGTWKMASGFQLEEMVTGFNKENTDYWAYVMEYGGDRGDTGSLEGMAGKKRMQIELTTGNNCPDIILLDTYVLPVNELAQKGYLEDLNPYLSNSKALDREELLEQVLDAYTIEDRLITIPIYFSLSCLVGRQSQIQQSESWTLQDMLDYGAAYPDAVLLEHGDLENYLSLLALYDEPFVAAEDGKYSVDREQIRDFLLLINRHNEKQIPELPYTPDLYLANHVLLRWERISDFYDIQLSAALMEGDISHIGYPSEDGRDIKFFGQDIYAIPLYSAEKEGAWKFLEYYIRNAPIIDGIFPIKRADFEQLEENQLAHEGYVPDENGVLVDPLEGGAMRTQGIGDWSYSVREITQEEIATVEEMLSRAGNPFMDRTYTAPWMDIFYAEVPGYLNGDKSLEDTLDIIVSRYQLYIDERH